MVLTKYIENAFPCSFDLWTCLHAQCKVYYNFFYCVKKKRKSYKWDFFLHRARHSAFHVNNKNLELLPLQSLPYHNANRYFFSVVPAIWRLQYDLADPLHLFQSQVNSVKLFSGWTLTAVSTVLMLTSELDWERFCILSNLNKNDTFELCPDWQIELNFTVS